MKIMDLKKWRWLLLIAGIIGLIVALPGQVKARPQQAIVLLYFQGTGQDQAILLEWATATEFETAGFVVDRANNVNGPYSEQIGFIPAEGSGIQGAEYEALDDVNVVNGQTYWYILVEIENDGTRNESDPISVTAGPPTPTATQTSSPTTQATTNSQATSTPTPSRTPTPTSTSQSNQASTSSTPTSTSVAQQATTQSGSAAQATATTAASTSQTNTGSGSTGVVEAASNPYPDPQETPSPTFVPDPGQLIEQETEPYPGPETEGLTGEGYPAGTTVTPEIDPNFTPNVQPFDEDGLGAISTQPPLNQQAPPEETTSPENSNTLFLWIGFAAAFLIFVGGVIGSLYLFTRRTNQK